MATMATGQITIVDYNDALSLQSVITSNHGRTVIYSSADGSYVPNWGSTSLVLTPSLFKSGGGGSDIIASIKSASQKWYFKADSAARSQITSGAANYTIGGSSPFTLTVAENKLSSASVYEFTFECIYIDPNTSLELTHSSSIVFQKAESGIAILPVCTAPNGNIFKNSTPATLDLKCTLWKGTVADTTATYQWFQDDPTSVSTTLTSANTGDLNLIVASTAGFVSGQSIYVGGDLRTVGTVTDATHMTVTVAPGAGNRGISTVVKSAVYDTWGGAGWKLLTNQASLYANVTSQTMTVYPDAVTNLATFKCKVTDITDGSGIYSDTITVIDYTDPYYIEISSSTGLFFKPGVAEGARLTAQLYQNGAVCALPSGKAYTWTRTNSAGTPTNFSSGGAEASRPGTNTGTGANYIDITGADVATKDTFTATIA